jgi:flagellar basal-body rod protein FlgF
MDRLIYTALNALSVNRDTQVMQAQNLANQNVPGFRADLPNEGGTRFLTALQALPTRAFQVEQGPASFSTAAGALTRTDGELDVAIADQGFFYVQGAGGDPALSRRGDLYRDADGFLRNGAGEAMLNPDGAPIELPAYRAISISDIGEIFIIPPGDDNAAPELAGVLATVVPDPDLRLTKGVDGRIRQPDGTLPAPDGRATVLQGMIEGSNVNPVAEMLSTMQTQRQFELGMRVILAARTLDEAGARVLQAPEG